MPSQLSLAVPWWGKLAAKVIISRLPIGYKIWKALHVFECGQMDDPSYAYGVFKKHFDAAQSQGRFLRKGFVSLELGPGDSLSSALIAASAYGGSASYLVDAGPYAQAKVRHYRAMEKFLALKGLTNVTVNRMDSVQDVLDTYRSTYLTKGLLSLRSIPSQSVDFTWSHTVLQEIRLHEFLDTMKELRRIMRPDGVCSHWVDSTGYLQGHDLRFSDFVWESSFISGSGCYTNRIHENEMSELFRAAGFLPEMLLTKRRDCPLLKRSQLASRFRHLSDEELRLRCFHILLRPN